jgi:ABC-type Na+ efflux pump permease subunit
MNIRTIGLVARREFVTRVRRRAFVLGIVLAPVLLLVLMAIGYAIGTGTEETKRVVIALPALLGVFPPNRGHGFSVSL